MHGTTRGIGHLLLAAFALLASALALAACTDNAVDPSLADVAGGEVDPGTQVTIDGVATSILPPDALVLERDGDRVLVVDAPQVQQVAIGEGDELVVTGAVRPLTDAAAREAGAGGERLADHYVEADLVRELLEARD